MYLDLSLNMLDISSFHIDKVKLAHIAIKFRNQFLTAARRYQLLVYKHKFINLSMPFTGALLGLQALRKLRDPALHFTRLRNQPMPID